MDFVRPVEAVIPGVQGRMLAVLAQTTRELNLRTVARLAGVSAAQASRVLPELVELGVVERRDVPPSALFSLVPEHVAARLVLGLADARGWVLDEMARAAGDLDVAPVSVTVFGSFARGEADVASDIDVVVVRPRDVGEDDDGWASGLDAWRDHVRQLSGNRVEVLEVPEAEVDRRMASGSDLWCDIRRDGVVVAGVSLDDVASVAGG